MNDLRRSRQDPSGLFLWEESSISRRFMQSMSMLPPHLEIEPVRSRATRPPRRLALLVTALVYGVLVWGGLRWLGSKLQAPPLPPPKAVATVQILEPDPAPAAPKGTGTVDPKLAKEEADPTPEPPPDFTAMPDRMPDRPEKVHFDASLPQAPGGDGKPQGAGAPGEGMAGGGNGIGTGPLRMRLEDMDVLYREQPEYPFFEMVNGVEDTVELEITIDEHGVPISVKSIRSQVPSLAKEAVRALKRWRFAAVKEHGVRVKATFHMDVQFMIANRGVQTKK